MASDPYPSYSYLINHNGSITSNRVYEVKGNIINKGGLIANNLGGVISLNNSGSILSNNLPFSGRSMGSIIYNNLEGVIFNNTVGIGGIANNISLDIISNSCFSINNNKTKAIVGNNLNILPVFEGTSSDISFNKTQGDIINNICSRINNNTTKRSIWSNNITGVISNNTADQISQNT